MLWIDVTKSSASESLMQLLNETNRVSQVERSGTAHVATFRARVSSSDDVCLKKSIIFGCSKETQISQDAVAQVRQRVHTSLPADRAAGRQGQVGRRDGRKDRVPLPRAEVGACLP